MKRYYNIMKDIKDIPINNAYIPIFQKINVQSAYIFIDPTGITNPIKSIIISNAIIKKCNNSIKESVLKSYGIWI